MEYKAEDFISFIENGRKDKVSPNGLELIAKRFRELECEVNKLSLGDVSGRSEQLKCYHYNYEWKSDGQGGNLKYCNDCKCYV